MTQETKAVTFDVEQMNPHVSARLVMAISDETPNILKGSCRGVKLLALCAWAMDDYLKKDPQTEDFAHSVFEVEEDAKAHAPGLAAILRNGSLRNVILEGSHTEQVGRAPFKLVTPSDDAKLFFRFLEACVPPGENHEKVMLRVRDWQFGG